MSNCCHEHADLRRNLDTDGYTIARAVLAGDAVADVRAHCPPVPSAGLRNAAGHAPALASLAESPAVRSLAAAVLGDGAALTRSVLFDKSPGANWALAFHQDTVVAVRERRDAPGFGPWSVKDGVPHVQPPAAVLESMVTVRLHLDDCGEDNGPLDVVPGSHRHGILDEEALRGLVEAGPVVRCACRAGDAVVMRPLLLHGSRRAERPAHRRVLHLEFAGEPLPSPLRWPEGGGATI